MEPEWPDTLSVAASKIDSLLVRVGALDSNLISLSERPPDLLDWLSLGGFLIGAAALGVALWISKEQRKQLDKIESVGEAGRNQIENIQELSSEIRDLSEAEKDQIDNIDRLSREIKGGILGTLSDFDAVMGAMVRLLRLANKQDNSTVYFMGYWFWFGADSKVASIEDIESVDIQSSEIYTLLHARIAQSDRFKTRILLKEEEGVEGKHNMIKWIRLLMEWRVNHFGKQSDAAGSKGEAKIEEDDTRVARLYDRYTKCMKRVAEEAEDRVNVDLREAAYIPAIMLIRDNGKDDCSCVYYIGESTAIEAGSDVGGFSSDNIGLVSILRSQFLGMYNKLEILDRPTD